MTRRTLMNEKLESLLEDAFRAGFDHANNGVWGWTANNGVWGWTTAFQNFLKDFQQEIDEIGEKSHGS